MEILRIIISLPGAIIAVCVTLIILRKSINRLIERLVGSERGRAKVGPVEIELGKPAEQTQTGVVKSEPPERERPSETETPVAEQGVRPLLGTVLHLLYSENDYEKAQEVFREKVEPKLDVNEKLEWKAVVLRISNEIGDVRALEKLETMVKENETNARLRRQLAIRYRQMGVFDKAKEQFSLAQDNLDINDERERDLIVDCYVGSSWCSADDNEYIDAIDRLKQLLRRNELQAQRSKILRAMADIAKDKDEVDDFILYAELALNTDPFHTDTRFNVAYAYSKKGYEKLALLHYRKLLDISPRNAIALNNIGVCYGNLKLKGKSVSSYLRSAEEKETLGMSNLAYNYLDAGFVNNARELIDEANKLSAEGIEVNPRVGRVFGKLKDLKENEDKSESKFLKEAEQERQFCLKYSEAKLSETSASINDWRGSWETPWGGAEIELDKGTNSFQIKLHTKEEDHLATALARRVYPFGLLQPQKVYKERNIIIDGRISGLTGRYTIKIDDANEPPTLLTAGKLYSATGYMIIAQTCERIEIMEKTFDDKTEFREWKKLAGGN